MGNELLDHALKYAEYGWRVFPCTKNKHPIIKEWQHKATTDPDTIIKWWTDGWPTASIGCACGPDSGIWVLDIDLPDGPETFSAITADKSLPPKIMEQETGSGGRQLFFQYNGTEIRNSARKVGPGIDVRGHGGYVVLPPSPHPSGNKYKWIRKTSPPTAPNWLLQLVKSEPAPTLPQHIFGNTSQYGQKALAAEIVSVSMATEGHRNQTLNTAAFRMGQLIAGGELEHDHAFNSLLAMAQTTGLKDTEARKTIESGINGGSKYPRSAPKDGYDLMINEHSEQNEHSEHDDKKCTSVNIDEHPMNIDEHKTAQKSSSPPQNLKAAIFQFIENSKGSFTTQNIDTEFGLTTRREKQTRSQALYMARENKLIKRDRRTAGKYHIIDTEMDVIDLDAVSEEAFPIYLPFDLQNYVKIPKHAIIVLAGSSNAGKTALLLETLRLNLRQEYGKHYYMSEMAPGEYKGRVMQFDTPLSEWKKVTAVSKSYDFEGAVESYNPNGLTCIDFLEEVDGEYFKIASSIREIYDALGDGVAMIAVQKKRASEVAFGGEATVQKARLYLVLDFLCSKDHSIVCALKVYKLKEPRGGKNLINHEMHFEIHSGSRFNVLMDWTPCSKVNRQQMVARYENPDIQEPDGEYIYFKVDSGEVKRVTFADAEKWQSAFGNIDVIAELERIADDSTKKPFLKSNGWYHQLAGILRKKNGGN